MKLSVPKRKRVGGAVNEAVSAQERTCRWRGMRSRSKGLQWAGLQHRLAVAIAQGFRSVGLSAKVHWFEINERC